MTDELNPEQRKELAGQLSASLAALPNVERTPDALMTWLELDYTIVELFQMHAEAEERLAELVAAQGPVPLLAEAEYAAIEEATVERDTIAAEIQRYMAAEVAKVDRIARFRHFLGRMVDGSKEEAKRAAARHKSWESRKSSLDGFILGAMDAMQKTRVETAANRLRIQNNPESVEVTDPSQIGDEFVEVELRCTLEDFKRIQLEMDQLPSLKRGQQTFRLAAIAAAIKETVKQPCGKCVNGMVNAVDGGDPVYCVPCMGTGFKRFPGARLVRGRHLRVE